MNNLLVRGLRQSRVHGSGDWRELVTSAIRREWPAPNASERTQEAERGLGIGGKPYYFYVLRAEENFDLVVFVLSEDEEADWPSDARGATPFDRSPSSGGVRTTSRLGHGKSASPMIWSLIVLSCGRPA